MNLTDPLSRGTNIPPPPTPRQAQISSVQCSTECWKSGKPVQLDDGALILPSGRVCRESDALHQADAILWQACLDNKRLGFSADRWQHAMQRRELALRSVQTQSPGVWADAMDEMERRLDAKDTQPDEHKQHQPPHASAAAADQQHELAAVSDCGAEDGQSGMFSCATDSTGKSPADTPNLNPKPKKHKIDSGAQMENP